MFSSGSKTTVTSGYKRDTYHLYQQITKKDRRENNETIKQHITVHTCVIKRKFSLILTPKITAERDIIDKRTNLFLTSAEMHKHIS